MPVFALIGNPLAHSYSKAYFTAKFEREGLKGFEYINLELPNLNNIKEQIDLYNLSGLNITIPFKETVVQYMDWLSPEAIAIAAVNTIKIDENKKLFGYNTDVIGFRESLIPYLKPYHTSALIFGNGGGSKAVAYVLKNLGIDFQFVSRIKKGKDIINYEQLTATSIRNAPLLINTTPLGMFPKIDQAPDIPYEGIDKFHLLYDLIYNPSETQFLKKGGALGAQTINGNPMLIKQAEEAWKIWKGNY